MSISFLEFVVLLCLKKLNGERTIYSIYHLLNGKKSSQTIQDAHLYQLTTFFNTYREITREQLEQMVMELQTQNLLTRTSEQTYVLTKTGSEIVKEQIRQYPFLSFLNGYKFQNASIFWGRISLLVQVISHLVNNEAKYFPIQKDKNIQDWVKTFLQQKRLSRQELSLTLYKELNALFQGIHDLDPAIIVLRLTGYHTIGLTKKQLCDKLKMEETLYHYQFQSILHFMMKKLQEKPNTFPLLSSIQKNLETDIPLTVSTNRTYHLLKKGYSVEEIGKIRGLKQNTIQDHIVELALQIPEFDISPYVDKDKIKEIISAKNNSKSKQLRHIREFVQNASYFEIRLVLTKYGDE